MHLRQFIFCLLLITSPASWAQEAPALYRDSTQSVELRVKDLLRQMTPEEKVGQLCCKMGWNYYEKRKHPSASFKKEVQDEQTGMLWATFRADPWTQKSLENGLTPALAAEVANALQRYVRDSTRLGIPLFLAEEAPHGHMAIGTTVFPTGLGMAATWSPELMQQMGEVISREIRLQGGHVSYGPILDLARDPRWSRVEETLGEDPVLTATLGAAMVRGLGGGDLSQPHSTLATLKHFIAYGSSEGGQNGAQTTLGERELHESFLPPFRKAIEAGALSVMTSYNSVDGIPCTANGHLLTDILRHQWHFRGFVVSDLYSIDGLAGTHRVAANRREAAIQALQAGVDVDLGASSFSQLGAAAGGAYLDSAVARVLRLKFEMGLFDNPFVDPQAAASGVSTPEHKAAALAAARASITLLKNYHALPLARNLHVLVCGPNAHNRYNLLGDYTAPQEDGNVKTILDGIRAKLPAARVQYVKGCAIRDTTTADITAAVQAAQTADVIICCVGGSSARDFKTSYQETGAAETDNQMLSDMDCGEGYDRSTLSLLGRQQQLLEAMKATGKPLVVIYIEGRPLDKTWAAQNADALLTAYYPGQEGGTAIADVLFGDYNPAGRLPISVPRHAGQLPVYYNKKAPRPHDYVETAAAPLFPYGFGLSYTTFAYSNLKCKVHVKDTMRVEVTCDITNTGPRDGEEVAQLYIHDDLASTVQPILQLKAFQRILIPKGETRQVAFTLSPDDLAIVDRHLRRVIEPGDFTIYVGPNSSDLPLKGTITIEPIYLSGTLPPW